MIIKTENSIYEILSVDKCIRKLSNYSPEPWWTEITYRIGEGWTTYDFIYGMPTRGNLLRVVFGDGLLFTSSKIIDIINEKNFVWIVDMENEMCDKKVWNKPRLDEYKKALKKESEERKAYWDEHTPQQQLDMLDQRLGKDVGAKKQRARLAAVIEKDSAKANKAQRVEKMLDEQPIKKEKKKKKK